MPARTATELGPAGAAVRRGTTTSVYHHVPRCCSPSYVRRTLTRHRPVAVPHDSIPPDAVHVSAADTCPGGPRLPCSCASHASLGRLTSEPEPSRAPSAGQGRKGAKLRSPDSAPASDNGLTASGGAPAPSANKQPASKPPVAHYPSCRRRALETGQLPALA